LKPLQKKAERSQIMTDQTKFEIAIARAEERAKNTDFDQHVIENEEGEFVVIDEGNGDMPQWLIEQIIYSVTGKLCLEDEIEFGRYMPHQQDWISDIEEPELPY